MSGARKEVRREPLEIPSRAAFERRLLVDGGLPSSKPDIRAPEAPSALLSRLQAFLPAMQSANQDLQQAEGKGVKIERNSEEGEEEGPYVELDLACGLFDLKDEAALAAAEHSLTQHDVAVERFGGDGSSLEDDSSDEDGDSSDAEAAAPMEEERGGRAGAGAVAATASGVPHGGGGGAGDWPQRQQQQRRAEAGGPKGMRARAKAKLRRRRAGIEVIS